MPPQLVLHYESMNYVVYVVNYTNDRFVVSKMNQCLACRVIDVRVDYFPFHI